MGVSGLTAEGRTALSRKRKQIRVWITGEETDEFPGQGLTLRAGDSGKKKKGKESDLCERKKGYPD